MAINRKINISILFLFISAVFTSCIRDANDVSLPNIESKVVVQSFISPQNSEIAIYVSTSMPVFGTRNTPDPTLPDATVTISDGTTPVKANFNTLKKYYTIDTSIFKITAGKTYFLSVSTADGRTVNASCTVPFPPDVNSVEFEFDTLYSKNGSTNKYDAEATLRWNDPPGQNNYYHTAAQIGLAYAVDTSLERWETLYGSSYLDYFTDKGKDGKKLVNGVLTFSLSEDITGGGITKNYEFKGIRYFLYSTDVNYYKYHETVSRSSSDPFSESVIIYTNIQGGLGCFGAFNGFQKTILF